MHRGAAVMVRPLLGRHTGRMTTIHVIVTSAAAAGAACTGGALYAFSSFVMPALARLPAAQGVAAMQSLNVTAVRAPFMLAFTGTAALSVAVVVTGCSRSATPRLRGSWPARRCTSPAVSG
jgi:hypothetical protein